MMKKIKQKKILKLEILEVPLSIWHMWELVDWMVFLKKI